MKILSQIYVGDNKFLLSLLGDTKDLSNLPTEYAADDSRFLNTDSNAVYVYTSADGWEITEAGQMKDLPVVSATDNGKVLKVANGVWSIGTDEGGGSLPANFPAEGAANANKFVGFDANGDYTAKEGGSGGGQFVVTFSDVDLENMTIGLPDKTGAKIYAAIQANQPVVANLANTLYIPLVQCFYESATVFGFVFAATSEGGIISVTYDYDSTEKTGISVMIPATMNDVEPLIVNLTLDGTGETPVLRGSATYGEIKDAQFAGKHVILKGSLEDKGDFAASVVDAVYDAEENVVDIMYASAGQLVFTGGAETDYVTIAVE